MKYIIRLLVLIGLFYLVAVGGLYFYQEQLIFHPTVGKTNVPGSFPAEKVTFDSSDNAQLTAWYYNEFPTQPTVLFFHGNAGNISHRFPQLKIFQELKLNALIIDYRGYGESTGIIDSEQDLYDDAQAAWDFLTTQKNTPASNIIIWGRSLGGSVAIDLGQKTAAKAIVVESSFSSVKALAENNFWFVPTSLVLRYQFFNQRKITKSLSPVVVIHSVEDEIIPFTEAKKIFDAARDPKQLHAIKGSHNEGFLSSKPKYLQILRTSLNLQ